MAKRIFLALGNPGKDYETTYHNAGFMAIETLLAGFMEPGTKPVWKVHKKIFEYTTVNSPHDGDEIIFIKPLTYMNESGKAAREALKKFSATPEDLIVLHDDSDIALGEFKTSFARNSAGHKGVQSMIDTLKTKAFTRIRIGIRPAQTAVAKRKKAGEFALDRITPRYQKILAGVFAKIAIQLQ